MSVRTHFVMLAQYHRWATRRLLSGLGALDDPSFRPIRLPHVPATFTPVPASTPSSASLSASVPSIPTGTASVEAIHPYLRDLSLPCGSIHGSLCHLYYAEQLWMLRLAQRSPPPELTQLWAANDVNSVWSHHFDTERGASPAAPISASPVPSSSGAPASAGASTTSAARPMFFNESSNASKPATGAADSYGATPALSLPLVSVLLSPEDLMAAQKARNAIGMRLDDQNCDWLDLVSGLTEGDIHAKVEYTDTAGHKYNRPRSSLLTHVFNHATWHRGQIAAAATQLGLPAPVLDLTDFLPEWEEVHAKAFRAVLVPQRVVSSEAAAADAAASSGSSPAASLKPPKLAKTYYSSLPRSQWPYQWESRESLWAIVAASQPSLPEEDPSKCVPVTVLLDGAPIDSESEAASVAQPGFTTALSLLPQSHPAASLSPSPSSALVAEVDGVAYDLTRPLPLSLRPGAVININTFSTPLGRATLWHSSAHVLGEALEYHYRGAAHVHLSDGPPLAEPQGGFFYDAFLADVATGAPKTVSLDDLPAISKVSRQVAQFAQPFERADASLELARALFAGNPFKKEVLDKLEGMGVEQVSLYKCGPLVDLCRGPHIRSTGQLPKDGITATKVSSSVLRTPIPVPTPAAAIAALAAPAAAASAAVDSGADAAAALAAALASHVSAPLDGSVGETARQVQRVYGMSHPSKALHSEWEQRLKDAAKADHRKLGRDLSLFAFHPMSPGAPFFLPHGTRVYNALVEFMRRQYRRRGFQEVRTPQVFDKALWERSGHWSQYSEDMFYVSDGHGDADDAAAAAGGNVSGTGKGGVVVGASELGCTGPVVGAAGAGYGLLGAVDAVAPSNPAAADAVGEHSCSSHTHSHAEGVTTASCPVTASDAAAVSSGSSRPVSVLTAANAVQALKPMNCPGHCLLYGTSGRSYRDLPLRLADFGSLHRNEVSGALSGLTRVRTFSQDDGHIFCAPEQLEKELAGCIDFIKDVYSAFDFPCTYRLSTRPENYIGDLPTWDAAEASLARCLDEAVGSRKWSVAEGDGAFYGPKVDVTVRDALGREHQCATVQLDFNLPRRFGLGYKGADGTEKMPVMIHRAILGSVERFLGVILEHTLGKLPLWLSPRQVAVCAVAPSFGDYAADVAKRLDLEGFHAEAMDATLSLGKQVRLAQTLQTNYILIVGATEAEAGAVSVRARGDTGNEPDAVPFNAFLERIKEERRVGGRY